MNESVVSMRKDTFVEYLMQSSVESAVWSSFPFDLYCSFQWHQVKLNSLLYFSHFKRIDSIFSEILSFYVILFYIMIFFTLKTLNSKGPWIVDLWTRLAHVLSVYSIIHLSLFRRYFALVWKKNFFFVNCKILAK